MSKLVGYSDDPNLAVRQVVAAAAGLLNVESIPKVLVKLVADKEMWVRRAAIRALMDLNRTGAKRRLAESVPLLVKLATADAEPNTRQDAVRALGEVGARHPVVIPTLTDILKNAPNADTRQQLSFDFGHMVGELRQDSDDARAIIKALSHDGNRRTRYSPLFHCGGNVLVDPRQRIRCATRRDLHKTEKQRRDQWYWIHYCSQESYTPTRHLNILRSEFDQDALQLHQSTLKKRMGRMSPNLPGKRG